jgi:hypothetical protein
MREMSIVEMSDEGDVDVDGAKAPKYSEHASRGMQSRDPALLTSATMMFLCSLKSILSTWQCASVNSAAQGSIKGKYAHIVGRCEHICLHACRCQVFTAAHVDGCNMADNCTSKHVCDIESIVTRTNKSVEDPAPAVNVHVLHLRKHNISICTHQSNTS